MEANNRRDFLKKAALAGASALWLPHYWPLKAKMEVNRSLSEQKDGQQINCTEE